MPQNQTLDFDIKTDYPLLTRRPDLLWIINKKLIRQRVDFVVQGNENKKKAESRRSTRVFP